MFSVVGFRLPRLYRHCHWPSGVTNPLQQGTCTAWNAHARRSVQQAFVTGALQGACQPGQRPSIVHVRPAMPQFDIVPNPHAATATRLVRQFITPGTVNEQRRAHGHAVAEGGAQGEAPSAR